MRPIRFIHTSDVHLDTSFSSSGFPAHLGARKREAIRATFRRILEDAKAESADMVLIAGDLFEHDRVTPDTAEFLKQQFSALSPIRVFIAPGNHDPFIQGSPYKEEVWPHNVHIFKSEEFQSVELPDLGVRVTGFGFNRTQIEEHHFVRLQPLPKDSVNIVLSHGSDVRQVPEGKARHGPFSIEEIAGKNVRYCALGHYHQQRLIPNPIDNTQAWYSGIPEGRGWDEEGDCGYLMGEIEGERLLVESHTCNEYPLRTLAIDCDSFSTREQILDAILQHRGTQFDSRTILRVRLLGALDPRLGLSFQEIEERLGGEVLHVQWDDKTQPAFDFEALAREKTLRGCFVGMLNERIASASGDERTVLERARLYGLQALQGREVRLR